MTQRTVGPRLLAAVVVALIGVMPRAALAQDDAFKDGIKAFDDRKWAEAAANMRKAIQSNAADSRRQIEYGGVLGINKKSALYLPHYYLGAALYKQEDCAGAVDAWATAEKQGAVTARPEFVKEIQAGYIVCETTKGVLPPAKFDANLQRAKQHYDDVREIAVAVSNQAKDHVAEFQQVRDQYGSAAVELTNANTALTSATRSRAQKDFDAANAATDRARAILISAQARLGNLIGETSAAVALAREVEGLLAKADDLERQVNTRLADQKNPLPAPLGPMREGGRDALARAHDRYNAGSKALNVGALNEAKTQVTNGAASYTRLLDELTRLTGTEVRNAIAGADEVLLIFDGLNGTLARRIAANPSLVDQEVATERDAIVKEVDGARRRLAAAKAASNLDGINRARNATIAANDRLSALLSRFGPLTLRERGVSAALEEGARQFFAGQYDKALATLSAPEALAPDAPLQLHVHLFRAASLFARYARTPKDESLRTQALAEVAECRKIDSTFEPDPRAFSPAFIRFFNTAPASASATADAR